MAREDGVEREDGTSIEGPAFSGMLLRVAYAECDIARADEDEDDRLARVWFEDTLPGYWDRFDGGCSAQRNRIRYPG